MQLHFYQSYRTEYEIILDDKYSPETFRKILEQRAVRIAPCVMNAFGELQEVPVGKVHPKAELCVIDDNPSPHLTKYAKVIRVLSAISDKQTNLCNS